MPTHPLNACFKTVATWHLPEAPDKTLTGALHYGPRWTEVELHGTFRPLMGVISPETNAVSYPVLHGSTREGELVTVLYAQRNVMKMNVGSGGFRQHETIISRRLYLGAHVLPDQTFPNMSFRVPALEIWLDQSRIEKAVKDNTVGHTRNPPVSSKR